MGIEKASTLVPDWQATDAVVYPDFELSDTVIAGIEAMVSSVSGLTALGVSAFSSSNNWAVSGTQERDRYAAPLQRYAPQPVITWYMDSDAPGYPRRA
ncbi:MAG: hypothetical protein MZV63_55045 [Marinilabiliales bacterium]|nr:hypothetical protein [Marinilabiliales bacterium]